MDAELDAVDNLLPGPARDAKVGNKSHDWHSKKPKDGTTETARATVTSTYSSTDVIYYKM